MNSQGNGNKKNTKPSGPVPRTYASYNLSADGPSEKYNAEPNVPDIGVSQNTEMIFLIQELTNNNHNMIPIRTSSLQQKSTSKPLPPIKDSKMKNAKPMAPKSTDNTPLQNSNPSTTQKPNEADEFIEKAIQCYQVKQWEKATDYIKSAAQKEHPLGILLYGIALRHGWTVSESSDFDLHKSILAHPGIVCEEFIRAIHELGMCYRHGWGVKKNKTIAVYYFEIAANLGDPDAQNDVGFCYKHGKGVKKDMHKAAKYYRMAAVQGAGITGNYWIFEHKYLQDDD